MKLIAKALLDAQKKIENATKDSKNPHFKNNYASLESVLDAVKGISNAAGIVIIQTNGKDSEGHYVETKLLHESGEEISSKVYLVLDKPNMQGLGSAITYGRRYSLAALFAIGQEDDDGNKASAEDKNWAEDTSFGYGANVTGIKKETSEPNPAAKYHPQVATDQKAPKPKQNGFGPRK